MEPIVFFALLLVVAVKAFTTHSIHALESKIRAAQSDEADVSSRLNQTESNLRTLEKEHKTLEQEIKHLENDKDLATLEVTKAGGKPLTEEQLDQLLNAMAAPRPANNKVATQPPEASQKQKTEPEDSPASSPNTTDETEEGQHPEQIEESAPHTPQRAPAPTGGQANRANTSGGQTPPRASDEDNKPSDQEPPPKNEQENKENDPDKKYRILVVDDNDELRNLLKQALSKDYEVLEAPDGFQALSQILKQKEIYDLIITDLNMPKVNGITLLEHLPEGIPTIVISAFLNKPEFKKALAKLKPYSVLEKPFQMATLRTAIHEAIASNSPDSDTTTEPAIST